MSLSKEFPYKKTPFQKVFFADIDCLYCNITFTPTCRTAKYCSTPCRDNAYKNNATKYPKDITLARYDIFQRDGFKCCYCGKSPLADNVRLHVEHIYPKEKGGSNNPYNLITSCGDCNLQKGNRVFPKDLMLTLWQRNENFNRSYDFKFEDMERMFDEHYSKITNGLEA